MLRDTLRDLKNGDAPKRLADRLYERGIVYVHVPKCAGSSVERALRSKYRLSRKLIDSEASFSAAAKELGVSPDDDNRHSILQKASEMRRNLLHYYLAKGVKCITGHAPLGGNTIASYSEAYDFATVLRDPEQRFHSHLAYNLNGGGGHGAINEEIDSFLERPRAVTMGALYVKYFSGLPMNDDFSTRAAIEASQKALEKMAVVGFVDAMDDFADDLTCLTGSQISIGLHNPTEKNRKQALQLNDAQKARIKLLVAPDREIYDWARKRFFTALKPLDSVSQSA
jgi:hypothetical protein